MIEGLREKFNKEFTDEKYQEYLRKLDENSGVHITFRVAETPIFIPTYLRKKLEAAGDSIVNVITSLDYNDLVANAVPENLKVPGETKHTNFLAVDFAVCKNEASGELEPQLIELQGFPSLFAFQELISTTAKEHWNLPENLTYFFGDLTSEKYIELMRNTICGNVPAENTILLEVEPEKQSTKVDFYCTKKYLGVQFVCLTEVIREGRNLFYIRDGVKTPIKRIYNRVIFDELQQRTDLQLQYTMLEEVDVEWAGHPNWFFKISKFTLPYLDSPFVPKTEFLHQVKAIPTDLENYVLKPLFSFAGSGVKFDVNLEDITSIPDNERHNYILMRKIKYADAVQSPEDPVKVEIRMLYLWPDGYAKPTLCTTLIRMSKGAMMGVKFNKNKTWVGGSIALFERGA